MARPSGARFILEQLTRPCFSFLPSGHHKSHTKSCPWLCCHIFSMSQPCFWKMSKFSPGCDPLLGSPRASQMWSQAPIPTDELLHQWCRPAGAGWPPHTTPEAKNRKVLAGQQAQTLLPEGCQATLLNPSSEAKLQRPEQPSYLDGSQHHTSPVHTSSECPRVMSVPHGASVSNGVTTADVRVCWGHPNHMERLGVRERRPAGAAKGVGRCQKMPWAEQGWSELHWVGHGGDNGAVWLLFVLEHKRGQMCLCLGVGTRHRRACALLLSDGCMA